jgi:predicted DNA-binding protein with PD1-like motif
VRAFGTGDNGAQKKVRLRRREKVMQSKLINDAKEKTYALIFDKGDEVIAGLTNFARQKNLRGAHFTAIGAFEKATLGYFDRQRKEYLKIPITEQVEVLSLLGDIARKNDEPKVHAHVVVGKSDGSAHGGHILEARVWPTLEVILIESPRHLQRTHDDETGLALIDLTAVA